jgi:hypothetical protein
MTNDVHEKAKGLIAAAPVEGIANDDRAWLDAHLESCSHCAELATSTERVIRDLRSVTFRVNPELVDRARRGVHLRARELQVRRAQLLPLWMSCAVSWVLGGLTLPLVWRGIEWMGRYAEMPTPVWILLIFLWWALPALAVAAWLSARGSRAADGR